MKQSGNFEWPELSLCEGFAFMDRKRFAKLSDIPSEAVKSPLLLVQHRASGPAWRFALRRRGADVVVNDILPETGMDEVLETVRQWDVRP